jgi:hypothetical protein
MANELQTSTSLMNVEQVRGEHVMYCLVRLNMLAQVGLYSGSVKTLQLNQFKTYYNYFISRTHDILQRNFLHVHYVLQLGLNEEIPKRLRPTYSVIDDKLTKSKREYNNVARMLKRHETEQKSLRERGKFSVQKQDKISRLTAEKELFDEYSVLEVRFTDSLISFLEQKEELEIENKYSLLSFFKDYTKEQGIPFEEYMTNLTKRMMEEAGMISTKDEFLKKHQEYSWKWRRGLVGQKYKHKPMVTEK